MPGLLMTRPEADSNDFLAALSPSLPIRPDPVVISPVLEIQPVAADIDLAGVQALLFTSQNGVRSFAARWPDRDIPALCVGAATARVATAEGFSALSADGDVAALASLAANAIDPEGGPVLHLHGMAVAGDLVGALASEGFEAAGVAIYDQVSRPLSLAALTLLRGAHPVIAPVFSARSSDALRHQVEDFPPEQRARLEVVSISDAAASGWREMDRVGVTVANQPDAGAMCAAIRQVLRR